MNEQESIFLCLKKIEESQPWEKSSTWTDYHFKKLSKSIANISGTKISTHTLKRLFGKIEYKDNYNPQIATKDALANYIGYDNWEAFLQKNRTLEVTLPQKKQRNVFKNSLFILIVFSFIGLFVIFLFLGTKNNLKKAKFEIENVSGVVPHTIQINYDISKNKNKKFVLDYGFNHPEHLVDIRTLPHEHNQLLYTYQIPGYYEAKITTGEKNLYSEKILANSDGWISFVFEEGAINKPWLDNMIKIARFPNGLTISSKEVSANGTDTNKVYYTLHRMIEPLGISGDDFSATLNFINGPLTGGITCYDTDFRIIGRKDSIYIRIMEENCHRFSGIKLGNYKVSGEFQNLSAFKFDLNKENTLIITNQQKTVTISLSGENIYTGKYTNDIGEIVGLEVFFKGSGVIKKLHIEDSKGKKFISDFHSY